MLLANGVLMELFCCSVSIIQIGEMCRKLETEEEKVLPFGTVPPTPRSAEEDEQLVKESKTKLNDVISDYEVSVKTKRRAILALRLATRRILASL